MSASNAKTIWAALALVLVSLFLLLPSLGPRGFVPDSLHIPGLHKTTQGSSTIPNIVHFVHLSYPNSTAPFEFPFRQFVAVYSAWYYLRPETIYIWTNVEEGSIEGWIKKAKSPYTQAVSDLPGVEFKHHDTTNQTTNGTTVHLLPNQSDFVRTDILMKYGGIYLDDDSYILRDLKPLRHLHYDNVVGRQVNGEICPAVILAVPNNKMMATYHALQDVVFKFGEWADHATILLTTLVREFQSPDSQALVLNRDSFFPSSWYPEDLEKLYRVHPDEGLDIINNKPTENITDFIANFKLKEPKTWKRDWRLSYALHGWTSGIDHSFNETKQLKLFGQDQGITLDYVLARSSNFALAVYPAVRHAVDAGVLYHVPDGSLQMGNAEVIDADELRRVKGHWK
ncbi:hypothetical protein OEA41_006546 [Lepraria neglecta]|uniref:Glycosyltransferase family 32 protein n=1 Tax=Lepraria neglecta TaxID=209136 RepID=A0AAE0DKB7_9LECA|nr:hypothetical protein OEA41_006546 [Lepraria neglecta]